MRRRWLRAGAAVLVPALLLATGGVAAADPPDGSGEGMTSGMSIDHSKWPQQLDRFIPGSQAFQDAYVDPAGDPIGSLCKDDGGDLWAYTHDFFTHIGSILDAMSKATGKPWLAIDDGGPPIVTTPWDADAFADSDRFELVAHDGGAQVFASPGHLLDFDHSASPFGPCTDDFAQFARPDASSPFGFTFYPAPDDGSVEFMRRQVDMQHFTLTGGLASGGELADPSQYWDPQWGPDNQLHDWDYSPMAVRSYCTDDANPFCATASFLHCPSTDSTDPLTEQRIVNCRTFNANVMLLNQKLALWLSFKGQPAGGGTNLLTGINTPGAQAPLDQWFSWAVDGKRFMKVMHIVLLTLAGALLAGGLIAGGLTGLLIAAGVIVVGSVAMSSIWGVVNCSVDFAKCLAQAGVDSLNSSMGLVMTAASTQQTVNLTDFSPLFDRLAGLAGVLLLMLFLLTLTVGAITGRIGAIIPAGVGLVQWAITIGLGSAILTALGVLFDNVADVIVGGNSNDAIDTLAKSVANAGTRLPESVSGGWLLAFVFACVATIAGAIIWLVLTVAPGFVPLAVALMILQSSGLATSGWGRRWIGRGFGILWTILLLRPTIALVADVAKVTALGDGIRGLIVGSLLLAVAAIAPWWIGRQFPLMREEGFGMGAALVGGAFMAGRLRPQRHTTGPAGRQPGSRDDLLRAAEQPPDTGGGGGYPSPGGPTGGPHGGPAGGGLARRPTQATPPNSGPDRTSPRTTARPTGGPNPSPEGPDRHSTPHTDRPRPAQPEPGTRQAEAAASAAGQRKEPADG